MTNNENQNAGYNTIPSAIKPPTPHTNKSNDSTLIILIIISFLAVAGLTMTFISQSAKNKSISNKISELESNLKKLEETNNAAKSNNFDKVEKDKYQAVFLDNGQVYFGKIIDITDSQITLINIYYLRTNQKVDSSNVNNPPSDSSLVKLGKELHGPEDKMFIERKETAFWENLKTDGEVTKAIQEYEKTNPSQ